MYYIVKSPTDDEAWNLYLLYKLSFFKKYIVGMYYIPDIGYYGPILKLEKKECEYLNDILDEIDSELIFRSYRMVCLRCGWCCEKNSGAFAFSHELDININLKLPEKIVKLYDGTRATIYMLDIRRDGRCIFYDSSRKLCKIHSKKPIICIVNYCARYAIDYNGRLYVRVGSLRRGYITFIQVKSINEISNLHKNVDIDKLKY